VDFDGVVRKQGGYIWVIETCFEMRALNSTRELKPQYIQTDWGWAGHSKVPLTGSPSLLIKIPMVLAPVHDRIKNSVSLITVMDGFTTTAVWERGNKGVREASSKSIML
jgi:hypothetical protein